MYQYPAVFSVATLIVMVLGSAHGIPEDVAGVARVLFWVFLLLALVSLSVSIARAPRKESAKAQAWREKEARRVASIKWLQDNYPLGCGFGYLGRKCMPTYHMYFRPDYDTGGDWLPRLECDYVDKLGVIHVLRLSYDEAVALKCATGVAP